VLEVMEELGYDLGDHYPQDLKKYLGRGLYCRVLL
jgi:hypothetical protein